ncbi:hypothetical protein [Empedobacter tilapiae]|nr:hypothetical protein [Empedobacter tilapiae]
MKKIIITFILLISSQAFSQVSIGKSEVEKGGLLDFGNDNLGIILPAVKELPKNPTSGTFLFDTEDKKVKVYYEYTNQNNEEKEEWLELSDEGSLEIQQGKNGAGENIDVTTKRVLNTTVEEGDGVIIGDIDANGNAPSGATGILVLEAIDKALILPKIEDPHLTIKSPTAGTMVFDTKSKSLAVFDGKVWNYWK